MYTVNLLLFVCENFVTRFTKASSMQIFLAVNQSLYNCFFNNTTVDWALSEKLVAANQFISCKSRTDAE